MTMKFLVLLIVINFKSISSYSLCGTQVKATQTSGDNYMVTIDADLPNGTYVAIEFNSDFEISVGVSSFYPLVQKVWEAYHILHVNYEGVHNNVFEVTSKNVGIRPYIRNMFIDQDEFCKDYEFVYTGSNRSGPILIATEKAPIYSSVLTPVEECGKRKLAFTELVLHGNATKPGDWPWHAAIYKQGGIKRTYGGGGTLISRRFVVTAAHCVSTLNVPDPASSLTVVLGKYNLDAVDRTSQEKEVDSVIIHENFRMPKHTDNDIALLKMKTDVNYNDYVQPACIWYDGALDKLSTSEVMGSVIGWGMDDTFKLSQELKHAIMPEVSYENCIMKKPEFYGIILKNRLKFCAGWGNGTSVCNGDSGGGYFIFVPDVAKNESPFASGAWYMKGIVSVAVARQNYKVCDPEYYVVFTDVPKYKDWIRKNTNVNFV